MSAARATRHEHSARRRTLQTTKKRMYWIVRGSRRVHVLIQHGCSKLSQTGPYALTPNTDQLCAVGSRAQYHVSSRIGVDARSPVKLEK